MALGEELPEASLEKTLKKHATLKMHCPCEGFVVSLVEMQTTRPAVQVCLAADLKHHVGLAADLTHAVNYSQAGLKAEVVEELAQVPENQVRLCF